MLLYLHKMKFRFNREPIIKIFQMQQPNTNCTNTTIEVYSTYTHLASKWKCFSYFLFCVWVCLVFNIFTEKKLPNPTSRSMYIAIKYEMKLKFVNAISSYIFFYCCYYWNIFSCMQMQTFNGMRWRFLDAAATAKKKTTTNSWMV